MKIGILTQPLHNNYGGLLQAYALQTTLKRLGHDAWLINREFKKRTIIRKIASFAKWIIFNYVFNRKYSRFSPSPKEKEIISIHTSEFIRKHIKPITNKIECTRELKKLNRQGFDAYIVGSDQVWRPAYSPCITNYFLDFCENQSNIKRISYAASFGVDNWEFTPRQTIKCVKLAKKFDSVSVREYSGVDLCRKYLETDAVHVLDPTMLLDVADYMKLIEDEKEEKIPGNLFVYILDETNEKQSIVDKVSAELNLIPFSIMPKKKLTRDTKKSINDCIFPPVTRWIKGFMDAEFVITDSFHGTVFAIIFNKPFITIANKTRGLTRFTSLLRIFDLEHRIITNSNEINDKLLDEKINFDKLNKIRKKQQLKAFEVLSILKN